MANCVRSKYSDEWLPIINDDPMSETDDKVFMLDRVVEIMAELDDYGKAYFLFKQITRRQPLLYMAMGLSYSEYITLMLAESLSMNFKEMVKVTGRSAYTNKWHYQRARRVLNRNIKRLGVVYMGMLEA